METPEEPTQGPFTKLRQTFWQEDPPTHERPVVKDDEVFALLEYAVRKGANDALVSRLSVAIHQAAPDPTEVAVAYSDLAAETQPVHGRSLLDSQGSVIKRLSGIGIATSIFFVLAVGNHIVGLWIADMVIPEEEPLWIKAKTYVWDYLAPFFWGGLGSCIYLLKRVQDLAASSEYEHVQLQGWVTRILIGGILGSVVEVIWDAAAFTDTEAGLTSNAIAFFTGVGVKVVYGAIERVIENFAARLNLDGLRGSPTGSGKPKPEGE